ncbi:hypothetical protein [Caproiciproducens faecalis]|uniref:RNA dependent RNA polymerase n=1 Tax=Caproiciproducens faecalis TaxID=2820301 RepID=A0ABS7DMH1_9FIRM|nr:hypothetical protein [Caproiciproducens faecalis]MBW7572487.1 hypothetical protein [Caproiciproducens faecalis]
MEQKQIKMYSFGRNYIFDGVIKSENLGENTITIDESFLTLAYECYKGEKLQDKQLIDGIIKVILPSTEEKAKTEWDDGLTFNDKIYYAWFATTGGMKKEPSNGKCETLFVREDFCDFAREFENLISLGKFKEIEESKEEICINKDVLSRISLGLSSCQMAGDMPDIIVLSQPKYRIVKDYKTVEKKPAKVENKKGELEDTVVYDLVDYHFDDDIEVFDGGGIATPKVFEQIKSVLELHYPVEFAIIRGYGIGIKGMITKFDILKYLNAVYKADTEYCKKVDDKFYLLDYWDNWQEVTDRTMLLNESMVKLAKYYKSENNEDMSTCKQRLSEVDPKYANIIGKLYVTKFNKSEDHIGNYRRLNYQLLSALALSKKDYYELIQEDIASYRKIIKPFQKDDKSEWQINIDAIRLFFKNIVKSDDSDSDEFEQEVQTLNRNIMNKCEELLNISENFVRLKNVKRNLAKQIEKRCRELACGKVTAKAKYQYIAVDAISYMNYAMYRQQRENGLKAGEFYSADCQNGDIRTIARNPLCAYSEVHNVNFVRNSFFDNYFSPCKQLIYFNQKSDILALMSSADCDGDACTVVDSDIIRDAVVIPKDGKYFLNTDDGHKEKMEYNFENRFFATYRASGNLIGSIALKSASINSNSQQTLDYYDTVNKSFVEFNWSKASEDEKAVKNKKLESGEWITTYKAAEQHRNYVKQRFYDNEKDIYIVLYNAMVSIDAPKTLYFPSSEDMKPINSKYGRKAWFLQFKEDADDVYNGSYEWTKGLLDIATRLVKEKLLDEIDDMRKEFNDQPELIQQKLTNSDYPVDEYEPCAAEIMVLYQNYTDERKTAEKQYNRKVRHGLEEKEFLIENCFWSQIDDELLYSSIKKYKREKTQKYKEIDTKYILLADAIIKKFKLATIANAIGNMKNCTEDFIINLFWPVFEYLNSKLQAKRYVYQIAKDGDISFLHEKYKKIEVSAIDNGYIVKNLHLEEKKRLKIIEKAEIRARVIDGAAIETIESEIKSNGFIWLDVEDKDGQALLLREGKPLLQAFAEKSQVNQYNLSLIKQVKVELVNIAKTKKSLGMTVTEIIV